VAHVLGRRGARARGHLSRLVPTIRRLERFARAFLRRPDVEAEMEEEMRLHIELEAEELMRNGVSADDARRRASIAFGGVQQHKEEAIEQSSYAWLVNTRRNIRIATRTLARYPTFTITATLALALAIAVNTTLYSVLDAMLNPSVGARNAEQLYELKYFGDPQKRVDFQEREQAFTASTHLYAAYTEWFVGFVHSVERGTRVQGANAITVRQNFFGALGIAPIEGSLSPGGDAASATSSVVISSRLRAQLFAPGEAALGATILLDGKPFTVIGVTTRYGSMEQLDHDVWLFAAPGESLAFKVIRLKDGVSADDERRQLAALAARLALAAGVKPGDTGFLLTPVSRQFHIDRFEYMLIGAGVAILLVACTNLANLQLARGLTRSAELALRSSLGASRRQIISQLMLESGVLAVGALFLAIIFAVAASAALRALIPPNVGDNVIVPHASWRMVAFAAAAAVVCLFSIGVLPAIHASRVDLNTLLKGRAGTGAHRKNRRTYGVLVVVQIALTLPLTCAAVLASRSAMRTADVGYLVREKYGYDPTPLVRVAVLLPTAEDGTKVSLFDEAAEILGHVRATPGVATAAVVSEARAPAASTLTVDDDDGAIRELDAPLWGYHLVTESYARTFGFTVVKGRDLEARGHADAVVVMDERSARTLWPRSEPIGRLIRFATAHGDAPMVRVEGVIRDHRSAEARALKEISSSNRIGDVYRLIAPGDSMALGRFPHELTVVVRANGPAPDVAEALRRNLRGLSSIPPVVMLETDYLRVPQILAVERFIAALFTVFGLIALGLSALGVFGIVAQSVTDRRREVAVRVSLGASPKSIVYTLLREGNVLVLSGVAIGLLLSKETMDWFGPFLSGVDLFSAPFFGSMCIALFAAMALVALVPAIRATQLDPMEVLRAE